MTLPEKIAKALADDVPAWLDISAGETKELCLGLFLMIYLRCLYVSLKANAAR